jgi:hypothetical protein
MLHHTVVQALNHVRRHVKDTSSASFTLKWVDRLPAFSHDERYLSGLVNDTEAGSTIRALKELARAPARDLASLLSLFRMDRNFTALPAEV